MTQPTDLTLQWMSGKGSTGTLTAMIGGKPELVDKGDIQRQKFREDFIKNLATKLPAINRQTVRDELMKLAAEASPKAETPVMEIKGDMNLTRPERFILSEINGVLCPMTILNDGLPAGRWKHYFRWSDGRRGERDFEPTLKLDDSRQIYFVPTPSPPCPGEIGGWSMDARRRWLTGEACPNPMAVFQKVRDVLDWFLEFERPEETTAVLAAWVFLSYGYQAWSAVPYLNATGPLGSGKSQLLDCLGRLIYRPLISSSMTGPALFRTLHDRGGTLILDEAERLRQDDQQELLTMLLAGYKYGGKAIRLEKIDDGQFVPKQFDVFGPKALGGIASLPATLASRCISIPMFRVGPDSPKPRRRLDENPEGWQQLRDDLHAMALEHGSIFLNLAGDSRACPDDVGGRNYQLWQPLLSIGKWLDGLGGEGIHAVIINFARGAITSAKENQTPEIDEIILTVFTEKINAGGMPSPGEILGECQSREPNLFNRYSAKGIATLLGRYSFSATKTNGRRAYRHTTVDDLRKVQTHYGVDLGL